jgi:hypothetical protein
MRGTRSNAIELKTESGGPRERVHRRTWAEERSKELPAKRTKNKILVDEGDPAETSKIKELLGFVDGQTTNPSLIAKNSEIRKLVALGNL